MSVINQMLKDLANRSKNLNLDEKGLMSLYTFSANRRKNHLKQRRIILSILLSILSGLMIITYFYLHAHFKPNSVALKKVSVNHTQILPVILTTITLQVAKDKTSLHLLLNKKPLYHITKINDHQLKLILENTHGITTEPQLNTVNSAIQSMTMSNESNGSFQLILNLKEGALLNTLELNEANKLPEMDIDFSYPLKPNVNLFNDKSEKKNNLKKVILDLTIEERYQQALELIDQGNINNAMLQLKKIMLDAPTFYLAQESFISLLIEKGDINEAKKYVEVSLKLAPSYIPFIQLNARLLVANGKVKEALDLLRQYSPSIEEYPEYNALMAALEQQQGQFLASAELYKKLLEFQPVNAVWWMGLGIALEKMGHNNQAIEAYAKADHIEDFSPELKAYVENRLTYLE